MEPVLCKNRSTYGKMTTVYLVELGTRGKDSHVAALFSTYTAAHLYVERLWADEVGLEYDCVHWDKGYDWKHVWRDVDGICYVSITQRTMNAY